MDVRSRLRARSARHDIPRDARLPAAADDAETEEHTETAKHIPIIALTANAYHEDIQKCLAAGMNAHLSKPINIDRAVRTIQGRKRICG